MPRKREHRDHTERAHVHVDTHKEAADVEQVGLLNRKDIAIYAEVKVFHGYVVSRSVECVGGVRWWSALVECVGGVRWWSARECLIVPLGLGC